MKDVESIKIKPSSSIKQAMEIIDKGAVRFAVVVDDANTLLGTLTDGDIRRAILKGKNIDDDVSDVYFKKPAVASVDASREELIKVCQSKKIFQIPIVDASGRIVSVEFIDELLGPVKSPNKVILMVGGLGTRLRPLTDNTPKPMLHVGGKPILQTIVERFARHGFANIVMCVNYKSDIIRDFFGDGSRFGVNIEYIYENKRLGTAGALSLLPENPTEPFFVMNGDLLTSVNFEAMLEFHQSNSAMASMCVREYDFQVPYGVVHVDGELVTAIEEKPTHSFFVSAGIYVLDPKCLSYIPKDEFFDMPTLFETLIGEEKNVASFPLREYWLDIGIMEEFERANNEYDKFF